VSERDSTSESPPAAPEPQPIFQRLDQHQRRPYTIGEYFRRMLWRACEVSLFRMSPRRLHGFRALLLRIHGARIGPNTRISNRCQILHPWLLEVGEWSAIGDDVYLYNTGPITIGAHSAISHRCHVCAGTHDYLAPNLPLVRSSIRVGNGVWIAADVFVGPDVSIGDNAVIGARSVVVKDIPPGVIAAGHPARPIKPRLPNA
jgi:putative colanic acid biosynthesis acetyltransferase WcaF